VRPSTGGPATAVGAPAGLDAGGPREGVLVPSCTRSGSRSATGPGLACVLDASHVPPVGAAASSQPTRRCANTISLAVESRGAARYLQPVLRRLTPGPPGSRGPAKVLIPEHR
jgi:hypothetical protein